MSKTVEFFTVDGGYVLMMEEGEVEGSPLRFACTAGDNDIGVALTKEECTRLGLWLINRGLELR